MKERYAYWERGTDIAWIPTGPEGFVKSEKTSWGIVDRNEDTGEITGLEVWDASKFLPAELLERLPEPGRPGSAAAA